ncbi:MAG: hypothetical protein IPO43_15400 [Rhodoferax sp.]|nr:hypothetical protein [Rhodoferax sp.]
MVAGIAAGAGIGTDTLLNIASWRGSSFGDSLTGGNAANGMTVGDGLSESFTGNAGSDTIVGGQGYDIANYAQRPRRPSMSC